MSEETSKKLNEELTDEKAENATGGSGMYRQVCPVCGRSFGTYGETYCSEKCKREAKFTVGLLKTPFRDS